MNIDVEYGQEYCDWVEARDYYIGHAEFLLWILAKQNGLSVVAPVIRDWYFAPNH